MIPASVYQMMRGNIVIVTSLMSIIFLKRRYFRHHWTGISSILIGVILVAMKGIFEKKDANTETTNPIGIVMVIVA
jgi:drug/metabolite transporter (DMT)-like permease